MASGGVLAVVNTLVGFIAYPLYLYYLGAESYGLWLLLAVILEFSRFGMLGIPEAMIKLVAEEKGKGGQRGVDKVTSTALTMLCGCGFIIVFSILVFNNAIVQLLVIDTGLHDTTSHYLQLIALLSFYVFISEVVNSILSGLGRMDQANYIKSVSRFITILVSIVFLFLGFGIESLIIGNFVSCLTVHLGSVLYIKKISQVTLIPFIQLDKASARKILVFGGGVSGMSLLNMFLIPFNKIILSRYVGLEAIPVFEIGCRVANQLRSFFHIIFKALLPEVSRAQSQPAIIRTKTLQSSVSKSIKLIFFLGLPLYSILYVIATPLLATWLGSGFIETMPIVLQIILPSSFMILLATPLYFTLLGMGRIWLCMLTSVMQAGLNVILVVGALVMHFKLSIFHITAIYSLSMISGSLIMILTGCLFIKRSGT